MKLTLAILLAVISFGAFAEHDAIYCGKIYRGADASDDMGDRPMLVLDLDKRARFNGDWADDFEYGSAYAAIVAAGGTAQANIDRALRSRNLETRYCVKGRFGGSAYDSWDVTSIDLTTDNVHRFDLASRFNIKE